MKKIDLIRELHSVGETWANISYPKAYLEDYLKRYTEARNMSDKELYAKVKGRK